MKLKTYLIGYALLLCGFSFSQTTIAKQSFESSGDTWNYTLSTPDCNNGGNDVWSIESNLGNIDPASDGTNFWGIRDLNGNCGGSGYETIEFASTSITGYENVTISFDYKTQAFESEDNLGYEIWEDGTKTADFVNLNDNSVPNWITITHNVASGVNAVYLILKARQNGGNDFGGFDNILLEGVAAVTPNVVLSSSNPATTNGNFDQGTDNNVIYNFDLSPTAANATFTELDFTTTGTYAASNLNNFKLWYSVDNTFNSSTDTFLENITTTLGPGNHTFSGFSQTINEDATGYFFITVDLPCNATNGNTISVNAVTTSGLTFSPSANKSGTAFNGGTHTFQTVSPVNATAFVTQDCENNGTTINWNDPLGCFDNVLVFVTDNPAGFTAAIPSGNGVAYAAATSFGGGTAFDGGFCVYKGTGNTENITNLVNGTTYTFKIFTRNDTTWSNGTTVTCTPNIGYCDAGPTSSIDSEIENITLNGENNNISNNTSDTCTGATGGFINDFTAMSADLEVGASYNLEVEFGDCNNGPQYDGAGGVWIDWNNDGDFDDANEEIGKVTLLMSASDTNVIENFNIIVPGGQPLGFYRMRIVQEEGGDSASVSPCGTFTYGSVEDYSIEIINACTPTHSISSIAPTSGPEGTEITITGSGFTVSTTALFDGIAANTTFVSNTEIIVEVPTNATTGVISVTENSCSINTSTFTIIDFSGSCSSPNFSDLVISEVYDRDGGNVWYMELYNPTNTAIDLDASGTDYAIERFGNIGDITPSLTIDLTGTVAANSVFTISLATDTNPCNTISYDLILNVAGINDNDKIILTKNGADHDVVHCPNNSGYSIIRDNTSNGPSTTFNSADWNTSNSESCSDLGSFTVPNALPTINTEPSDVSGCTQEAIFTVNAVAGNGGSLTYQWYFNDRVSSNWAVVNATNLPNTVITGETSNELTLGEGFYNYSGYQFYCLVTEDGSCSVASDAVQLNVLRTIWNGTAWSNGSPDINSFAIIDGNYDSVTNGNLSCCTLIINTGNRLNVGNSSYVEVDSYTYVNGEIWVETHGNFVQNNDLTNGFVVNNASTNAAVVNKSTSPMMHWYDYTYWSSPITNATVNTIDIAPASRRYFFNAANFEDVLIEDANTDTFTVGHDDIDDNGDDWEVAAGTDILPPGVGLAATVSPTGFMPGIYQVSFKGAFNNAIITTPIHFNGNNGDLDWNLIGNPYPSAISADAFFAANSGITGGAIYLWSHNSQPLADNSGNEILNFVESDYAVINGASTSAGTDGIIPTRFVPSGQSFFIQGLTNGNATFNNAMRVANTTSNNQFFRQQQNNNRANQNFDVNGNRLWLNLTTDSSARNQISVAYVNGATADDDGMYYDAIKNLSSGTVTCLYSLIEDVADKKYVIQGKGSNDLTPTDVVPLGFRSSISEATIYSFSLADFEGNFFTENPIFIKDKYLNIYHDLKNGEYYFESDTGEFNNRFEIVYQSQSLSTETFETNATNFTIVELDNDQVAFNTNSNLRITNITIIDVLGREVSQFKTNTSKEIITLSQLSSAPYIAKVKLSNGQVITKKAIKK